MQITFSALAEREGGAHSVLQKLVGCTVAVLPKDWDGNTKLAEGEILPMVGENVLRVFVLVPGEGGVVHNFPFKEIEEVRYL